MATQTSLADLAVETLAAVVEMGNEVDNQCPERHAIRSLKRVAEEAITSGLRLALELSWQAKQLKKLSIEIADANNQKVGAGDTATEGHNAKVSGPEAALSPEGRARLPGWQAEER